MIAPTVITAFNVGGQTMHKMLLLPVEHSKNIAKYFSLSDNDLKHLRQKLKDVTLVIVDEVSMVSNDYFTYMLLLFNFYASSFN